MEFKMEMVINITLRRMAKKKIIATSSLINSIKVRQEKVRILFKMRILMLAVINNLL